MTDTDREAELSKSQTSRANESLHSAVAQESARMEIQRAQANTLMAYQRYSKAKTKTISVQSALENARIDPTATQAHILRMQYKLKEARENQNLAYKELRAAQEWEKITKEQLNTLKQ